MMLEQCIVSGEAGLNNDDASKAFQFQSPAKSFVCVCATEEEKNEWVEALQRAIDTLNHNVVNVGAGSGHVIRSNVQMTEEMRAAAAAPVWTTDKESKHCALCSSAFTMLKRRHHCRQCGKCVCDKCSTNRCVLPNVGVGDKKTPVRVCDNCMSLKLKYKSLQHVRNSISHGTSQSMRAVGGLENIDDSDSDSEEKRDTARSMSMADAEKRLSGGAAGGGGGGG